MSTINAYSSLSKESRFLLYTALINQRNLLLCRKGNIHQFIGNAVTDVTKVIAGIDKHIDSINTEMNHLAKA